MLAGHDSAVESAQFSADGKSYSRGFEVIEYPHITRYHIYDDAEATSAAQCAGGPATGPSQHT